MTRDDEMERALAAARRRINAQEDRIARLRADLKAYEDLLWELQRLRFVAGNLEELYVYAKDNAERRLGRLDAHAQTVASAEGSLARMRRTLADEARLRAHYKAEDGINVIKAKVAQVEEDIEAKRREIKAADDGLDGL
jgi:vacuolar-type H+-ATPase subunit I/STV1